MRLLRILCRPAFPLAFLLRPFVLLFLVVMESVVIRTKVNKK